MTITLKKVASKTLLVQSGFFVTLFLLETPAWRNIVRLLILKVFRVTPARVNWTNLSATSTSSTNTSTNIYKKINRHRIKAVKSLRLIGTKLLLLKNLLQTQPMLILESLGILSTLPKLTAFSRARRRAHPPLLISSPMCQLYSMKVNFVSFSSMILKNLRASSGKGRPKWLHRSRTSFQSIKTIIAMSQKAQKKRSSTCVIKLMPLNVIAKSKRSTRFCTSFRTRSSSKLYS